MTVFRMSKLNESENLQHIFWNVSFLKLFSTKLIQITFFYILLEFHYCFIQDQVVYSIRKKYGKLDIFYADRTNWHFLFLFFTMYVLNIQYNTTIRHSDPFVESWNTSFEVPWIQKTGSPKFVGVCVHKTISRIKLKLDI